MSMLSNRPPEWIAYLDGKIVHIRLIHDRSSPRSSQTWHFVTLDRSHAYAFKPLIRVFDAPADDICPPCGSDARASCGLSTSCQPFNRAFVVWCCRLAGDILSGLGVHEKGNNQAVKTWRQSCQ